MSGTTIKMSQVHEADEATMDGYRFGKSGKRIKPSLFIRNEDESQMEAEFTQILSVCDARHNTRLGDREYLWRIGPITLWSSLTTALYQNFKVCIRQVREYRSSFAQFVSNEEFLEEIIKQSQADTGNSPEHKGKRSTSFKK